MQIWTAPPLFFQAISAGIFFEFSGKGAGDSIKVECLGASDRLRGTHSGAMIDYGVGMVVCSPVDTAIRLSNKLVNLMGWTRGVTAPIFKCHYQFRVYLPILIFRRSWNRFLFDCGFYYTDRPDGSIEIYAPSPLKTQQQPKSSL